MKLFVLPESGREPYLKAIQSARESIKLTVYTLNDSEIIKALKKAHFCGVKIFIIYEPHQFLHEKKQVDPQRINDIFFELERLGIKIKPVSRKFAQCHYKILLIDEKIAFISTGNLNKDCFDGDNTIIGSRDFIISTCDGLLIDDLNKIFYSDWNNIDITVKNSNLILGPVNQRAYFISLINSTEKDIFIYQQDITDSEIFNSLLKAISRNVSVNVLMTPYPFYNKKDSNIPYQEKIIKFGGKVRFLESIYIHAKIVVADYKTENEKMYLGSCNFYKPSIDKNREIGIHITQKNIICNVMEVFLADWENGYE